METTSADQDFVTSVGERTKVVVAESKSKIQSLVLKRAQDHTHPLEVSLDRWLLFSASANPTIRGSRQIASGRVIPKCRSTPPQLTPAGVQWAGGDTADHEYVPQETDGS